MSFIMRPIRFAPTGYIIEGSGLFDGSSGYLSRTPSSSTTSQTDCTIEFIFKPCELDGYLFAAYGGASNSDFFVYYGSAGDIYIKNRTSGSTNFEYHTPNLLRDFSAYYHVVIGIGKAAGDVNLAINGTAVTLTADTAKTLNQTMHIFGNAAHEIGRSPNSSNFFGKYLARVSAIDGTKLSASSFGETTDDGFWQINDISDGFDVYNARVNPIMTGNTAPSGTASASTEFNSSYQAWEAFGGGGDSEYWSSTQDSGVGWLQYQFTSGQTIIAYRLQGENAPNTPSDWTLKGSNNGSDFTTLDTQSDITQVSREYQLFEFTNTTSYTYYRLDITGTANMTYLEVNSFELLDSTSGFGTNGFLLEGGTNVAAGTDSSKGSQTVTGYAPVPVNFGGTNEVLTRGAEITGASDGKNLFFSFWFRSLRTPGSGTDRFFANTSGYIDFRFETSNVIRCDAYNASGSIIMRIETTSKITDTSWHHLMLSTNGSTQHLYLDGVEDLNGVTNTDDNIDYTRNNYVIGRSAGSGSHFNGDMADYIFDDTYVDLSDASNRAKFISTDGEPVDPGDDGATAMGASPLIYLNSNALATWHTNSGTGGGFTEGGTLSAGATVTKAIGANNFTKTGTITATNDSPTNDSANDYGNYASVMGAGTYLPTISEQGLRASGAIASQATAAISTIPFNVEDTEGFYVETQWLVGNSEGANFNSIGIMQTDNFINSASGSVRTASSVSYQEDGNVFKFGSDVADYATWGANTGHRPVLFVKAGKIWFGLDKNAGSVTWNGDPANGTGEAASGLTGLYNFVHLAYYSSGAASSMRFNFGAIAFLYDPPTGGKSIHTGNLPTPAIINPDDHFHSAVVTHGGSSTASTCTFNLDTYEWLAIIKNITGASEDWYWIDSLRGANHYFNGSHDSSSSDVTDANVMSVSGTTFTLGSTLGAKNYLVQFHKAGLASATGTNSNGTLTSGATSVNTLSGFTMSLYTPSSTAVWTIGHGQSTAPEFVIGTANWGPKVYHKDLTDASYFLYLNLNNAQAANTNAWNSTAPTTSVVSVGTLLGTINVEHTLYSWHGVEGYSSFGSYEGNAAADGTFINTGMYGNKNFVKNIDSAYSWHSVSTTEQGYNTGSNPSLQYDNDGVGGGAAYDIVSNGLKMRTANANYNSAETFIYGSWGGRPLTDGAVNQGRAK